MVVEAEVASKLMKEGGFSAGWGSLRLSDGLNNCMAVFRFREAENVIEVRAWSTGSNVGKESAWKVAEIICQWTIKGKAALGVIGKPCP